MSEELVIRYRDQAGHTKEQTMKTTAEAILLMKALNNVGSKFSLYASDGSREVFLARSIDYDK